jgi:hypothetical protein
VSVPYGIHTLYLSCSDQGQFRGIRTLFDTLGRLPAAHTLDWRGEPLDLHRRRSLDWALISGHGRPVAAGFQLSPAGDAGPQSLRLPGRARLYLLGCYQGRRPQRLAWAEGTGVGADRVFGCEGETESALSTCLLLHLLEGGPESIERWFAVWSRCNDAFRPHFLRIRNAYARAGADPLAALAELKVSGNLDCLFRDFEEFLAVIERRPACLTGLM